MIPQEIQNVLNRVGLEDVVEAQNDESITLTMTKDEARALLDAWAFAIGPVMAGEMRKLDANVSEKALDELRGHLTHVWIQRNSDSKEAVTSLTVKLTEITDQFIAEVLGVEHFGTTEEF